MFGALRYPAYLAGCLVLYVGNVIPAHGQEFPSVSQLAKENVALSVTGFVFTGGARPGPEGNMSGNGLEVARQHWEGSGFIIDEDGTIVTNYHVATKALEMEAQFDSGATYQVLDIRDYDASSDLAILKINANQEFPAARLGDSDTARPLNPVIAVGNPGGQGINITEGKISQVVRDRQTGNSTLIQHTAPIAPGNSGGALYGENGVVGVNVSTWFGTQFHQAIPINIAKARYGAARDNIVPLKEVFNPTIDYLQQYLHPVGEAQIGQVGAAQGQEPGVASMAVVLAPRTDYMILVDSPPEVDLDVLVSAQGADGNPAIIGYGGQRLDGIEVVAITNNYPREAIIQVLNYEAAAVNFGIELSQIAWGFPNQ